MSQKLLLEPAEPEVLTVEELPVLTASLQLPTYTGWQRFNRYYRRWEASFRRYCRTQLLPLAEAALHQAMETAGPLPQWEASLTSTVTWQSPEVVSLYTEMRLQGPGGIPTRRRGDTWYRGLPLTMAELFPRRAHWRRRVLAYAAGQIRQNPQLYPQDWQRRLVLSFRARRFYLTEEGLCFFYPAGTLSPTSAVTFCLPWDKEQGPIPPEQSRQEPA